MQGWPISAILLQCSVLYSIVAAQSILYEYCGDRPTVPNFDLAKFATGKWYRQRLLNEPTCKCITDNYNVLPGNKIRDSIYSICGTYRGTTNITMSLSSLPGKFMPLPHDAGLTYYIVDTDYDEYAVSWACAQIGRGSVSDMVVTGLTRERYPSQSVLDKLGNIMTRYMTSGFEKIFQVDQMNC